MSNNVDLSQLAVERGTSSGPGIDGISRRWFSRYVLPAGMAIAFIGLLAWATRDRLLPARPVTVVPVLVARAEIRQEGTPLFQAAGWIEPRPVATVVSSLAPGVIEKLHVVEGQRVTKGEPIANLLDVDARLRLREAQAELQLRQADQEAARNELANAQIALRNPVQLRAAVGEAESALAQLEAELDVLPSALEAAETRWMLARENVRSKESAGDAIAGRLLRQAKGELATDESTMKRLRARQPVLIRQKQALQDKRDALADQLELKLELTSRVSDAQAAVKSAEAQTARARLSVETAELELSRTVINSPINGRVLSVHGSPGRRVNGLDPHSELGSSAIVSMYDPAMLQVRVDVRLEHVPQVQLGQSVRIETAAVPAPGLQGAVVSVTSLADIQKNTLQVKAAIIDPPDVIRPEMLGQVTFLTLKLPGSKKELAEEQQRILIPRQLVLGTEAGAHVWVADRENSTASKRAITLGRAGTDELVEVASGLGPTDKLISSGFEAITDGQRIRITAEDAKLGSNNSFNVAPRTANQTNFSRTN